MFMKKRNDKKGKPILIAVITFSILLFVSILICSIIFFARFQFDTGRMSAYLNAERFLSALEHNDNTKAFSFLFLYDTDLSVPYSGNRLEAEKEWLSRVEEYRKVEVYLLSHRSLVVERTEEGIVTGSVFLTLYEMGVEKEYRTDLVFSGADNSWRIADISAETIKSFYEAAVSGNMNS